LRRLAVAVGSFALIANLAGCLLDADKPDIWPNQHGPFMNFSQY
jgi:hypothetical protein